MKICVLGNSHVGEIKHAWDILSPCHKDISFTFFASRASGLKEAVLRGKELVAASEKLKGDFKFTSGGKKTVKLNEYDIFLIYGFGIDAYCPPIGVYSSDCLASAIKDHYKKSKGFRLAELIRSAVDTKILIAHVPLPSGKESKFNKNTSVSNEVDNYARMISTANNILFKPLNMEILEQSPLTRVNNGYVTRSIYSKGSRSLSVGDKMDDALHPKGENKHMNIDFAVIFLNNMLNKLKSF
jgi:hypothetical protein